MIHTEDMTDQEIRELVTRLVAREVGPVGYIRFVQQLRRGRGNYTEERHQWLDGLTVDEICDSIEQNREHWREMGWLPAARGEDEAAEQQQQEGQSDQ
jgi:hypothetical protein